MNLKTSPVFTPCRIIFMLNLINFLFWITANSINVYKYAVVGAIFEMMWLFMVAGMFVLPVLSVIFWRKKKFQIRLHAFTVC